eukprot:31378-Pelagococcus_subviridis.AAC.2
MRNVLLQTFIRRRTRTPPRYPASPARAASRGPLALAAVLPPARRERARAERHRLSPQLRQLRSLLVRHRFDRVLAELAAGVHPARVDAVHLDVRPSRVARRRRRRRRDRADVLPPLRRELRPLRGRRGVRVDVPPELVPRVRAPERAHRLRESRVRADDRAVQPQDRARAVGGGHVDPFERVDVRAGAARCGAAPIAGPLVTCPVVENRRHLSAPRHVTLLVATWRRARRPPRRRSRFPPARARPPPRTRTAARRSDAARRRRPRPGRSRRFASSLARARRSSTARRITCSRASSAKTTTACAPRWRN